MGRDPQRFGDREALVGSYGAISEESYDDSPSCCVCGEQSEELFHYSSVRYCKHDFNSWIRTQLSAAKRDESDFIKFYNNRDGKRQAKLTGSDNSWRAFLDSSNQRALERLEAPMKPSCRNQCCSSLQSWCTQQVQSLKTCNNVLCCLCCCPWQTEDCVLEETKGIDFLASCKKCVGNPYYERCPYCLSRVERLEGCPHMKCGNPKCKKDYHARAQVECPCACCSTGVLLPTAYSSCACWVVGPSDCCKCVTPKCW